MTPDFPTTPKPGGFAGVPYETYRTWDALSQSRLKSLARSPAHYRWNLAHPREDTETFLFGRMLHAAILEPAVFKAEYVSMPKVDGRTKEGKEIKERYVREHPGKTIVSQAVWEEVVGMSEAVQAHKTASRLLYSIKPEFSFCWQDRETGVLCKGRADALCSSSVLGAPVLDIKTCQDASPQGFARAMREYRYHNQAAWYLDGLAAVGKKVEKFILIAVEKLTNFVGVYEIDKRTLDYARQENSDLLKLFAYCSNNDEWPSYSPYVEQIGLPEVFFQETK